MDSSISTTEKSYLLQKRRRESDDNSHLMFPIKKDINQIPNTQTQTTPKTKNRFVLNHSFVNNKICTNNQVNTSVNNSINSNNALQNSLNNSLYGSNYTNKNKNNKANKNITAKNNLVQHNKKNKNSNHNGSNNSMKELPPENLITLAFAKNNKNIFNSNFNKINELDYNNNIYHDNKMNSVNKTFLGNGNKDGIDDCVVQQDLDPFDVALNEDKINAEIEKEEMKDFCEDDDDDSFKKEDSLDGNEEGDIFDDANIINEDNENYCLNNMQIDKENLIQQDNVDNEKNKAINNCGEKEGQNNKKEKLDDDFKEGIIVSNTTIAIPFDYISENEILIGNYNNDDNNNIITIQEKPIKNTNEESGIKMALSPSTPKENKKSIQKTNQIYNNSNNNNTHNNIIKPIISQNNSNNNNNNTINNTIPHNTNHNSTQISKNIQQTKPHLTKIITDDEEDKYSSKKALKTKHLSNNNIQKQTPPKTLFPQKHQTTPPKKKHSNGIIIKGSLILIPSEYFQNIPTSNKAPSQQNNQSNPSQDITNQNKHQLKKDFITTFITSITSFFNKITNDKISSFLNNITLSHSDNTKTIDEKIKTISLNITKISICYLSFIESSENPLVYFKDAITLLDYINGFFGNAKMYYMSNKGDNMPSWFKKHKIMFKYIICLFKLKTYDHKRLKVIINEKEISSITTFTKVYKSYITSTNRLMIMLNIKQNKDDNNNDSNNLMVGFTRDLKQNPQMHKKINCFKIAKKALETLKWKLTKKN